MSGPATARIDVSRGVDLDHQFLADESREIAIQHRRPQPHAPPRPFEDVVHNGETMQILIGERQEDLEPVRRERWHARRFRHV